MKVQLNPHYLKVIERWRSERILKWDRAKVDHIENKLLVAREEFKTKDWQKIIKNLKAISTQNQFYLSEKNCLISYCYGMLGRYEEAIYHGTKALPGYRSADQKLSLATMLNNLAANCMSLNLLRMSEMYLLETLNLHDADNDGMPFLNMAYLAYEQKNSTLVTHYLERSVKHYEGSAEYDQYQFFTRVADLYFKIGDFVKSRESLEKIITKTSNTERNRAILTHQSLLYLIDENKFEYMPTSIESFSEQSVQWRLLKSLYLKDLHHARQMWQKLKTFSRRKYPDTLDEFHFVYKTDYIYFTALINLRDQALLGDRMHQDATDWLNQKNLKGKPLEFFKALISAGGNSDRVNLIEAIWNVEYDPKFDARFYKLSNRLRKEFPNNIIFENGVFSFVLEQVEKKAS